MFRLPIVCPDTHKDMHTHTYTQKHVHIIIIHILYDDGHFVWIAHCQRHPFPITADLSLLAYIYMYLPIHTYTYKHTHAAVCIIIIYSNYFCSWARVEITNN